MIIEIIHAIIWGAIIAKLYACFDGQILLFRPIFKKQKAWRFVERALLCLICFEGSTPVHMLLNSCITGISFAICFDPNLNIIRGLHPLHMGSQSNTELFFKNNAKLLLALELLALIICITIKYII